VHDKILVTSNFVQVAVWDLDEVEVSLSDSGSGILKNPKWNFVERIPTPLIDWPPSQRCGDSVFLIIPRTVGISILSFALSSSVSGSFSFSVSSFREVVSVHSHDRCDTSFSRDLVVYANCDPHKTGGPRWVVCRPTWKLVDGLDDDDSGRQLALERVSDHPMPFLPYTSLFDAFSSRVVFYRDSARFYIGSFVVVRPS